MKYVYLIVLEQDVIRPKNLNNSQVLIGLQQVVSIFVQKNWDCVF